MSTPRRLHDKYELVMGLEVHAQLLTKTKLFSPMTSSFGAEPNTQVNEICAGLPGVLPVLNRQAVEFAIRAGLAFGCDVREFSQFARKNYFYPDLPKGYQISQFEYPICEHGSLTFTVDDIEQCCNLTRIHLEEDAGKSIHVPGQPFSHVDLNRAGVPLIEIVSEPELRTPDEAVAYLKEMRNILMYIGVCDGNMEEGSLRCDANISIRPHGDTRLGTKVELKNMNSFKFLKDAINYEFRRQIDCVEFSEPIYQETRLWRTATKRTVSMRRKEGADDYRYFPDPDLPPLRVSLDWIAQVRDQLGELPAAKRSRYRRDYGLPSHHAGVLTARRDVAEYFEQVLSHHQNPKTISNWIMTEVLAAAGSKSLDDFAISPQRLADLVALVDAGDITGKIGKRVFAMMLTSDSDPQTLVDQHGLKVERDEGKLGSIIDEILAKHPNQLAQFRGGKTKLKGFFVGQIMRATKGQADPKLVQQMLDEKLPL